MLKLLGRPILVGFGVLKLHELSDWAVSSVDGRDQVRELHEHDNLNGWTVFLFPLRCQWAV